MGVCERVTHGSKEREHFLSSFLKTSKKSFFLKKARMLLQYSHSCLLLSCLPAGPRGRGPMPPPAFCAHGLRQSSGWARRRWWPCPTAPVPRWCRQHGDVSAPGPACVGTGGFEAPRGASPATADGRVTAFESAFPSYLIACKNVCHVRLVTGNLYQDRKERSNQRRDIAASEPP